MKKHLVGSLSIILLVASGTASAKPAEAGADPAKAEKLVSVPVSQIIKDLKMGSTKSQAMKTLARQVAAGDAEVLAKQEELLGLVFPLLRSPFDKKLAEDAAVCLSGFGIPIIEPLLKEMNGAPGSTPSSKVLAVRALGLIGAPAKEKAGPVLNGILTSPNRKSLSPLLINEIAIALALMGGPFDPELVPDIAKGMMQIKDVDDRFKVASQIMDASVDWKPYVKDLEIVALEALKKALSEANSESYSEIYRILVEINTTSSVNAILIIIASPKEYPKASIRAPAITALSAYNPPSEQILSVLMKAMRSESFYPGMVEVICRTLMEYGAAAESKLPELEVYYSKDLPRKKMGTAQERTNLFKKVEETIRTIKAAKQAIAGSVTNQVPQKTTIPVPK